MAAKTNVKINNKEYYKVTRVVGRNLDGTSIKKQFYGSCKKEAEEKATAYLLSIKIGLPVGFDKILVGPEMEKWLENVKRPTIKHSSYLRNLTHMDKIRNSPIWNMPISDVRAPHLQGFLNGLSLGLISKKLTCTFLASFFSYCVKADLLQKTPMLDMELPTKDPSNDDEGEINVLSNEGIAKLCEMAKTDPSAFPYVFLTFTGLRSGEFSALEPGDIKCENGKWSVIVSKTYGEQSVAGENRKSEMREFITKPKTSASNRDVPIVPELWPMLERHMELEQAKAKELGFAPASFFSMSDGSRISEKTLLHRFDRIQEKLGLERRKVYDLRHTFCTLLSRTNVGLERAAKLAGHANIQTTVKYYVNVGKEDKEADIGGLSRFFPA
ncbi:MAG: site-specific integrase [Clostridiales bacterium]|nr:site-specific integrase [Clostridiales bacterium]